MAATVTRWPAQAVISVGLLATIGLAVHLRPPSSPEAEVAERGMPDDPFAAPPGPGDAVPRSPAAPDGTPRRDDPLAPGRAALRRGALARAIREFEAAAADHPTIRAEAMVLAARAAQRRGGCSAALARYEAVAIAHPDTVAGREAGEAVRRCSSEEEPATPPAPPSGDDGAVVRERFRP